MHLELVGYYHYCRVCSEYDLRQRCFRCANAVHLEHEFTREEFPRSFFRPSLL
jgi:hypothetical protein